MSHPRRYFENNCVYFLTNRLARGLPFVPCEYINNILKGILAKASARYPSICICHYLWMRNHYHILIVTKGNPSDVAGFMNILNGEMAKAVVKFLGKRNVKVWTQRYNCIRLLTLDVVIEKIAYLYLNPVTANLVDKSCRWPGITSYGIEQEQIIQCEYIRPSKLQRLSAQRITKKIDKELIANSVKGKIYSLIINPYAWVECFENPECLESYRSKIAIKISSEERKLEEKRVYPVLGVYEVKTQDPYQSYIPESKGKRMFCMSSCVELRRQFIELYKNFCERCVQIWKYWQEGKLEYKYPEGAFIPPRWPLSSVLKLQT